MLGMRKSLAHWILSPLSVDLLVSLKTYGANVCQNQEIRSSGRR
jgi:hypothetical protein